MFWLKKNSKGFVTIYTLLILSIIFSLIFFTLKLEIMKNRYNSTWINVLTKESKKEEVRVYLLSKLVNYSYDYITAELIEDSILQEALKSAGRIYYNASYLEYNEKDKKIILTLVSEDNSRIIEKYSYIIKENKIKFEM
ncbi:hypothetical protein CLHOM_05430 [Clostridium homopropionicum DSM 5847]|uniref:Uncharacterized protein n=1 Tax=Clostridium homopropionicum DSM 5847 TaxID=1121318 RepID=A0A0L6ZDB0_9CLOT|nr:hypothetical protein [Clostridium homopropionicum]KOA20955.1 hypothetical protein CLHOM_05430 [Clostridium homopropionicum DSM 5847]SFG01232.1 hypothetical protein SAMN04488501_104177 [Clostridium homopropionicum]